MAIRIAIAEDHTILRRSLISILNQDEDLQVVEQASDGEELLQKLDDSKVQIDVCMLDVNMPKMNGYETLIAVRERFPKMKFLVLSQLDHEYVIIKMLKAGASGYLPKNSEPEELKLALRTIMVQPYYNSELIDRHLIGLITDRHREPATLTEREIEFLKLCCTELIYKEMAQIMNVTDRTIAFYRQSLFDKLKITSRTGLALYALQIGLVPIEQIREHNNSRGRHRI